MLTGRVEEPDGSSPVSSLMRFDKSKNIDASEGFNQNPDEENRRGFLKPRRREVRQNAELRREAKLTFNHLMNQSHVEEL
jgi:hypothetical protein